MLVDQSNPGTEAESIFPASYLRPHCFLHPHPMEEDQQAAAESSCLTRFVFSSRHHVLCAQVPSLYLPYILLPPHLSAVLHRRFACHHVSNTPRLSRFEHRGNEDLFSMLA